MGGTGCTEGGLATVFACVVETNWPMLKLIGFCFCDVLKVGVNGTLVTVLIFCLGSVLPGSERDLAYNRGCEGVVVVIAESLFSSAAFSFTKNIKNHYNTSPLTTN